MRPASRVPLLRPAVRTMDTRTTLPPPKTVDRELLTSEHRAWRAEVLKRAGYQCQAVVDGQRCPVRAPARLFADHIVERRDGGAPLDPANGQCLCGGHHTLKTAQVRADRLGVT